MEKKLYNVVMLPNLIGPITPNAYFINKNKDILEWTNWMKVWATNAQHLYITDPFAEVKAGDWAITRQYGLHKANSITADSIYGDWKVICSTDPALGLPGLQQSFLQSHVKSQGAIKQVALETVETLNSKINTGAGGVVEEFDLKTVDGCVVVKEPKVVTSGYLHTDLPKEPIEMYELPTQPSIEDVESAASSYVDRNTAMLLTNPMRKRLEVAFVSGSKWQAKKDANKKWTDEDLSVAWFNGIAQMVPTTLSKQSFENWLADYKKNCKQ